MRNYLGESEVHVCGHEQTLVSLKLKKPADAEVGRTFAVRIEGG